MHFDVVFVLRFHEFDFVLCKLRDGIAKSMGAVFDVSLGHVEVELVRILVKYFPLQIDQQVTFVLKVPSKHCSLIYILDWK